VNPHARLVICCRAKQRETRGLMPYWVWMLLGLILLGFFIVIALLVRLLVGPSRLARGGFSSYESWWRYPWDSPPMSDEAMRILREVDRVAERPTPGFHHMVLAALIDAESGVLGNQELSEARASLLQLAEEARQSEERPRSLVSVRSLFAAISRKWCRIPPFCGPRPG